MSGLTLPAACLCLVTGALLGGLFLGCKLVRGLLYGGRLCIAVLDVLFCLVWSLVAFLCALVVDKGRLRLFQVALQGLGAWGAVVALDPFVDGMTGLVRRFGKWLAGWLRRPLRFLRNRWRAGRAAAKSKRAQRKKALQQKKRELQQRKKQSKGRSSARGKKPRYRKGLKKSVRYAPKKKKPKNPLEKLT